MPFFWNLSLYVQVLGTDTQNVFLHTGQTCSYDRMNLSFVQLISSYRPP